MELDVIDSSTLQQVYAMAATKNPDILLYHEIAAQPDCEEFRQAMQKEITSLEENQTWTVVPCPQHHRVIKSTWTP